MKTLLVVIILSISCYSQNIYTGFEVNNPIRMGFKYPQVMITGSIEYKYFHLRSNIGNAHKYDGGIGISGVNAAYLFTPKKLIIGSRHSWLAVDKYYKQAIRPVIGIGKSDFNIKYIHSGSDNQNNLQSILFEKHFPMNDKWRFETESGITWFHSTFSTKRYFGAVMRFSFNRKK